MLLPRAAALLVLALLLGGCLSRRTQDYLDSLECTSTSSASESEAGGDEAAADVETASTSSGGAEADASGDTGDDTTTTPDAPHTSSTTDVTDTTTGEPPPVCGNGLVEPGEECDGQAGCTACTRDIRVFVTSKDYKAGDLMGTYLADALCLNRADDAGLPAPERFKAWLRDSDEDARDRFHRTRPDQRPRPRRRLGHPARRRPRSPARRHRAVDHLRRQGLDRDQGRRHQGRLRPLRRLDLDGARPLYAGRVLFESMDLHRRRYDRGAAARGQLYVPDRVRRSSTRMDLRADLGRLRRYGLRRGPQRAGRA